MYEGYWKDDKRNGKGIQRWTLRGDEYVGDFVNDIIHGFGELRKRDGTVTRSQWVDGRPVSHPVVKLPSTDTLAKRLNSLAVATLLRQSSTARRRTLATQMLQNATALEESDDSDCDGDDGSCPGDDDDDDENSIYMDDVDAEVGPSAKAGRKISLVDDKEYSSTIRLPRVSMGTASLFPALRGVGSFRVSTTSTALAQVCEDAVLQEPAKAVWVRTLL